MLLSLHKIGCLSAILELDIGAGPRQVVLAGIVLQGVFFWFPGGTVSHFLGSVGFIIVVVVGFRAGGSFSSSCGSCSFGSVSSFCCRCAGSCFCSHCVVPACLDACRPLSASAYGSVSSALAPPRIFMAISKMHVPDDTLSLQQAFTVLSLLSHYSFLWSYCIS